MNRRAFALMSLAVLNAPAWAAARKREALVIGNDAYPDVPLRNPGNDASAVSRSLIGLGFNVRLLRDAGWRSMIDAVQSFIAQSADADMRLVFYAGHGAQVRGQNYLIPVDAPMSSADELTARSLNANEILERLGRYAKGLNLVILDACRNNPANRYTLTADGRRLKVRGAAQGLAAMQPPSGTLIAFSTSPGQVADDGVQQANSLYTRHLLRNMATPGVSLEQMFKRVRIGVMRESAQRQRPWEESSLTVDYCLAGC